jgi:hypothetical protein
MAGEQVVQRLPVRLRDLLVQERGGATTSTLPGTGASSAKG